MDRNQEINALIDCAQEGIESARSVGDRDTAVYEYEECDAAIGRIEKKARIKCLWAIPVGLAVWGITHYWALGIAVGCLVAAGFIHDATKVRDDYEGELSALRTSAEGVDTVA